MSSMVSISFFSFLGKVTKASQSYDFFIKILPRKKQVSDVKRKEVLKSFTKMYPKEFMYGFRNGLLTACNKKRMTIDTKRRIEFKNEIFRL